MLNYGIFLEIKFNKYRQTSNISCILVGNKIVDNSDVVGASPVGVGQSYECSSAHPTDVVIWKELRNLLG